MHQVEAFSALWCLYPWNELSIPTWTDRLHGLVPLTSVLLLAAFPWLLPLVTFFCCCFCPLATSDSKAVLLIIPLPSLLSQTFPRAASFLHSGLGWEAVSSLGGLPQLADTSSIHWLMPQRPAAVGTGPDWSFGVTDSVQVVHKVAGTHILWYPLSPSWHVSRELDWKRRIWDSNRTALWDAGIPGGSLPCYAPVNSAQVSKIKFMWFSLALTDYPMKT